MPEALKDWKAMTPETLVAPVEHVRRMFDEDFWKCSRVAQVLCFAELHPDDEHVDLDPYRSAFATYRKIIGPTAAQQFDMDHKLGTAPAIFHAFKQVMAAGIRSEIHRVFNDLLQIGIA